MGKSLHKFLRKLLMREYRFTLSNGLPLVVRAISRRQAIKVAIAREREIYERKQAERYAKRFDEIIKAIDIPDELVRDVLTGMSAQSSRPDC